MLKRILCVLLLSASAFAHSVTLKWDPSVTAGVDHYRIYRSLVSGGPYILMGTVTADKLTFTNGSNPDGSPLVEGQMYCYVATSVIASTESVNSNEKCVIIPTTPLPPVQKEPVTQ